ncbi:hypothetical protein [Corynebacterium sp. AOP40-4SA-5]|uniref:hypothetical protein n=1 Tax=Corynebacterium sp. AOP40-4SA-5 TaxID=3457678 RepID=UPI0040347919
MTDQTDQGRPSCCCGVCPELVDGGVDCTCRDNPRCPNYQEISMPDQTTTVTDDAIRRAHEWCDLHWPTDENRTPMADVIRHYRATVPAPPATLADELREWAGSTPEEGAHWDEWDDFNALADRVETVEEENERLITEAGYAREAYAGQGEALKLSHQEHVEALREVARLSKEREGQEKALHEHGRLLSEARAERDEFQNEMISSERKQAKLEAEVQRLTTELGRKEASRQHYIRHAQTSSDDREKLRAEVERLKSEVNAFIDAHVVNAAKATALPDPA